MIGEKVLVQSFPKDPLVRLVYEEDEDSVLVWRGALEPDDVPAPCPKERVFAYDAELIAELKGEIRRNGRYSPALVGLWKKAKPYYKHKVSYSQRREYGSQGGL